MIDQQKGVRKAITGEIKEEIILIKIKIRRSVRKFSLAKSTIHAIFKNTDWVGFLSI